MEKLSLDETDAELIGQRMADRMWNRKDIKPPLVCELKRELTDSDRDIFLNAKKLVEDDVRGNLLKDHVTALTNEHYVVSRFVYKIKNQFRKEKSLSDMQKIVKCLKRLQAMEIITVMEKVLDCFSFEQCLNDSQVYLISRQSVEFCLIKLMGMSALLAQTGKYCQDAFIYVASYLNLGHLIPQNVVLFAAASRIWFLTKSLCLKVCDWYQALMGCLQIFPPTKLQWMPDDTILPANLMEWLISQGFLILNEEIDKKMSDQLSYSADSPQPLSVAHSEDLGEMISRVRQGDSKTTQGQHLASNSVEKDNKADQHLHPVPQQHSSETVDRDKTPDVQSSSNDSRTVGLSHMERIEGLLTETKPIVKDFDVKQYIESRLETKEKIEQFQSEVESRKLNLGGSIYNVSKLKKKKISALLRDIRVKMEKGKRIKSSRVAPELMRILRSIQCNEHGK